MPLTPEQRTQRAKIAANARWSRETPGPSQANAREGWRRKIEDRVDPGRALPESERDRRVQAAIREEMARLSYLSSVSRSERKNADAMKPESRPEAAYQYNQQPQFTAPGQGWRLTSREQHLFWMRAMAWNIRLIERRERRNRGGGFRG